MTARGGIRRVALAATIAMLAVHTSLTGFAGGLFAGITAIETQPAEGKKPQTLRFHADLPFQYQKQVLNDDQVLFRLYNARFSDGVVTREGLINLAPSGAVESAMYKAVDPNADYEEIVLSGKGLAKQNLLILGATEMAAAATIAKGQPGAKTAEKVIVRATEKPLVVFPKADQQGPAEAGGMAAMAIVTRDAGNRQVLDSLQPGAAEPTMPRIEIGGSATPDETAQPVDVKALKDVLRKAISQAPDVSGKSGISRKTVDTAAAQGPQIEQVQNLTPAQQARAQHQAPSGHPSIAALETNPAYPQPKSFYPTAEPSYTADQVYQAGYQAAMTANSQAVPGYSDPASEEAPEPAYQLLKPIPRYMGGARPIEATTYDLNGRPITLRPTNQAGASVELNGSSGYNTLFQAEGPDGGAGSVSRLMAKALDSYKKNDFDTALTQISEALQVEKANPALYAALAEIQVKLNALSEAEKAYAKAADLAPGKYDQRYAQVLVLAGKRKEAIAILEEQLRRKPNQAKVAFLIGTLYEQLGDTRKALPYLEKAAQLNPGSADVTYNLGLAYELLGKNDDARRYYEKTLNLNPAAEDAIQGLERVKS